MTSILTNQLIETAFEARKLAYAPYSGFYVGAALLTEDDKIFTGCNIENAAFSATICAEQAAVAKAVSEGSRNFVAIAICGGQKDLSPGEVDYVFPCGNCRQILAEFAIDDFKVYSAIAKNDFKTKSLEDLLPKAFNLRS